MESASFLTTLRRNTAQLRGFTLVEMLVVLGIITSITAFAITGQSSFNKSVLLTETAYGVAFSARQAQTFGISSRNFQQGGTAFQRAGYGVHFDRATPTQYQVFADTSKSLQPNAFGCPVGTTGLPDEKPGNCRFDGSSVADGIVSSNQFSRGFTIQSFCAKSTALGQVCSNESPGLSSLDIVFTRPNTTTTISGVVNGAATAFTCAVVTIADSSGQATRSVRFSSLGEISITTLGCP